MDIDEIDTWDKLARAFFDQYKFNLERAPLVWDLSNMKKKRDESFKEYAQRWRAMAARVTTHLLEKDLTFTFINTLEETFPSHLVGHTTANLSEVIAAGCRIVNAVSASKLQVDKKGSVANGMSYKVKEQTISVVNTSNFTKPQFAPTASQSPQVGSASLNLHTSSTRRRKFTRVPIPLS